jgi:hypothetical protein
MTPPNDHPWRKAARVGVLCFGVGVGVIFGCLRLSVFWGASPRCASREEVGRTLLAICLQILPHANR